jgi:hypothetical protein
MISPLFDEGTPMNERRQRIMKRLVIEELERREMLTGPPEIAMAATGLTNNSVEDFYKAQVGTEIGGPAGVYMVNQRIQPVLTGLFFSTIDNDAPSDPMVFDASTGVGQQTITTGANTPGIGSFASATAGPSRAGGTGNPNSPLGGSLSAADAAMEQLFGDPDKEAVAQTDSEDEPAEFAERAIDKPALLGSKQTARRAWSISPDELEADAEAKPAAAAADH